MNDRTKTNWTSHETIGFRKIRTDPSLTPYERAVGTGVIPHRLCGSVVIC